MLYKYLKDTNVYFRDLTEVNFLQILFFVSQFCQKNGIITKNILGFYMNKLFSPCPVETTLNLVGNKWKFLIVRDLLDGTKRFGELKKTIGETKNQSISQKVLTQNLRELESAHLIKRKVYAEVPPRVEYSLTDLGKSLYSVLEHLALWGETYKKGVKN